MSIVLLCIVGGAIAGIAPYILVDILGVKIL
jgi:hypothetical protein